MTKTLIALAAAATLVTGVAALAAPASAGTAAMVRIEFDHRHDSRFGDRRFDSRIAELDSRIRQGRYSGQLSRREASRLSDRLDSIKWTKRDYERSGGGIDRREASKLDSKLDDLSRDVFGQRHDGNRW